MRYDHSWFLFPCALLLGLVPGAVADTVLTAPGRIEAEDPGIAREGGLGNLAGWWSFWSNGHLTAQCQIREAGLYKVAVRAAGSSAKDPKTGEEHPRMIVEVGEGPSGKFEFAVKADRKEPELFVTRAVRLEPGRHTIRVAFVNDFGTGGQDRNLFVDWLGIGPVSQPDESPALSPLKQWLRQMPGAASPEWSFADGRKAEGWRAWQGTEVKATNAGLEIRTTGDRPLVLSPRIDVVADESSTLSLVMQVERGEFAEIGWITDAGLDAEWHRFPIIADGQPHVYVLDLSAEAGWTGKVIGLTLRPSESKGARAVVKSLRLADRPYGPAEIRVDWFGLEDAIARAGQAAALVCTMENVGGEPTRRLSATISLPEGVELLGGAASQTVPTLEDKWQLVWKVRASKPLQGRARLTIRGENTASVDATAELKFTPGAQVQPAVVDGKPYVPEPKPVASDYLVGAYYYPGWKQHDGRGWDPIYPFPERKPVLGWYEEGDPQVADWHIKWALDHGISFFAYDWYWSKGRRWHEHAIHEGLFKSRYRKQMKFCLLWANHNPPGTTSEEDLLAVTRFWLDNYFHLPEYVKIDGKPLILIFSPRRITDDMGVEAAAKAFEKMRAMCRKEGLAGLYLAGCMSPMRNLVEQMKTEGYDAATGYNYPSAGARPEDGKRVPYERTLEGYRSIWETIGSYGLMDYIPVTDPGWDSRPWHGETALTVLGKHPDKFKQMLQSAKEFVDKHPVGREKRKMVLVEAWNEFGEGAAIEPHREFGFGFLDAVRDVFTGAAEDHVDPIPADVGLAVPQWSPPAPPKTAWEFNTDGDGEGWGAMMGMDGFEVSGGRMKARTVSRDPAFSANVRLDAYRFGRLAIRMKLDKGSRAQFFWSTPRSATSEANSVSFATTGDGEFHEYALDLKNAKGWRGKITGLRLDPNSEPASRVEIDYVRLLP